MAALTAGVQYSLSSNQNNGLMPKQRTSKNKTLFFVKLTDSCLKAVEDYLRCCQQVRNAVSSTDLYLFYFLRAFVIFLLSSPFLLLLPVGWFDSFFFGHVLKPNIFDFDHKLFDKLYTTYPQVLTVEYFSRRLTRTQLAQLK